MDFLEYVRMCQEEPEDVKRFNRQCNGLLYKVEAGDTLYSISRKYKLKVRDLMRVNPFVDVYHLQIGEELCIPVAIPKPMEGMRPYVVKQGDTVLSILKKHQVSFEQLAGWNRSIAALRLPVGMIILVPDHQNQAMMPPMEEETGPESERES